MLYYSHADFYSDVAGFGKIIRDRQARGIVYSGIYGVPRGGIPFACALSGVLALPLVDVICNSTLVVDDIVDSGKTRAKFPHNDFISLWHNNHSQCPPPTYYARQSHGEWIHFWWEGDSGDSSITDSVTRLLQYIGEDPNREGLIDTPKRVIKSYSHLFSGYSKNPEEVLTTFSADGYDEMVLLRDIELYSMCEHHMLPFIGKAHVAYIPNKKIIGISKLARLVEIYARRLQIQERIGSQVTKALMDYLQPKGAACIIEAQHLCMKMRGVEKQNSVMTTSSLTGVFLDKPSVREELLRLIKP